VSEDNHDEHAVKFTDLAPKWVTEDGKQRGVMFACPVHAAKGLDETGSADCLLARVFVPNDRWSIAGNFGTMTITPSVKCSFGVEPPGKCHWHGEIKNGEVSVLPDSTS